MANGSSMARMLSGTTPGLLDPTQRTRLLRFPGSQLTFASFHPLAASCRRGEATLNFDENNRPKRIVIESLATGESFWRYVPRAKWAAGVQDEGVWPREVFICGDSMRMSLDQWDIYKLDSVYECFVPLEGPPLIRKTVEQDDGPTPHLQSSTRANVDGSPSKSKRQITPPFSGRRGESNEAKKRGRFMEAVASDNESVPEDEEEDWSDGTSMIVDEPPQPSGPSRARSKSVGLGRQDRRAKLQETRKQRWNMNAKKTRPEEAAGFWPTAGTNIPTMPPPPPPPDTAPPSPVYPGKRKGLELDTAHEMPRTHSQSYAQTSAAFRADFGDRPNAPFAKRMRTHSPEAQRREAAPRLAERRKTFRAAKAARAEATRQEYNRGVWKDILGVVPEDTPLGSPQASQAHTTSSTSSQGEDHTEPSISNSASQSDVAHDLLEDDEEVERLARLEESRRKLAELEQDRPLWEQAARRRAATEEVEDLHRQERKAQAQAEAASRRQAAQEASQRRRREQEDEHRKQQEREARARYEAESRRKKDEAAARRKGPWTIKSALEHYNTLSVDFDQKRYGPVEPLTFNSVPWPMLSEPQHLRVEDITWEAVEQFFSRVKVGMRTQDFKMMAEKARRRFHPDRWHSRGLFASVPDHTLRDGMEVAVNSVAQAVTALLSNL